MSEILMCLLAFVIIATCAQTDVARGIGCVLTIVFTVTMITFLAVGAVLGLMAK